MSSDSASYQLIVIGGGPGGVTAARTAALQGWRVALISGGPLMGYGLHGAFKSKSMYEIARAHHAVQTRWDVLKGEHDIDFQAICRANANGADDIRRVHRQQLESLGVEVIAGMASFLDPHTVEVELNAGGSRALRGERFVIATGTTPRVLPGVEADGRQIMISDDVVDLEQRPESILILGAGVIGCEFASIFASLGSRVVLIDTKPIIFSHDDRDLSVMLACSLRQLGVDVRPSSRCASMTRVDGRVHTDLGDGEPIVTEAALIAIGRIPNTARLNLEAAGVHLDRWGYISVDNAMQSNVPHIYAVGDVGLRETEHDLCLVHVAEAEGRAAVWHMCGDARSLSTLHVPFLIFTLPMIAGAGMSEREAREHIGPGVRVGKYAHARNHRAHAMRCQDGFVKLIVGPEGDDRVLGVRAIGEGVDSIVGEISMMIAHELPYTYLLNAIQAHPSLSESLQGAARIIAGDVVDYEPLEEFQHIVYLEQFALQKHP